MAVDSVFNGDPTTPNVSASGEAAFGIDLATGQLYYRNPQDQSVAGWRECAGSSGGAPINSPAFTGIPTAPTAAASTDTTQIATTAMVQAAIAAAPPPSGVLSKTVTTLTAAQVLALNTVPVILVPAPGAGKYIQPVTVLLEYKHVTTPYHIVGSDAGANISNPANQVPWFFDPTAWTGVIDQAASQLSPAVNASSGAALALSDVVNQPLQVVSNNLLTTGDGTLTYTVYYTIETAV